MDIKKYGFMVEKWDITGESPEELFTFDLRPVDGKPAVTNLYVNPSQIEQVGVCQETLDRDNYGITGRHPYPLPFSTGELVKLNAPIFKRPIYGVLYSEDDLNGTRYIFLGYISFCRRGYRFNLIDLSYEEIDDTTWGFRVIDWLHHAAPSELPRGQESLKEISDYLRELRSQSISTAERMFFRIFDIMDDRSPYHITPFSLPELITQIENEEDHDV